MYTNISLLNTNANGQLNTAIGVYTACLYVQQGRQNRSVQVTTYFGLPKLIKQVHVLSNGHVSNAYLQTIQVEYTFNWERQYDIPATFARSFRKFTSKA